jgi:hypothetical protein
MGLWDSSVWNLGLKMKILVLFFIYLMTLIK